MAQQEESPQYERERCIYNPMKKKACCQKSHSLTFSASAAMLMLYYKVLDNIHDERFLKKLFYRMLLPTAARARKKALFNYADVDAYIGTQMKAQALLEQENCASIDCAGEPTANSLAFLFEQMATNEVQTRVLHRFGFLLGKWVYMIDALDDLEEDMAQKRYNPFIIRSKSGVSSQIMCEEAVLSLNMTMGELIKTFQLLELNRYQDILENVLNLGLKNAVREVVVKKQAGHASAEKDADLKAKGES